VALVDNPGFFREFDIEITDIDGDKTYKINGKEYRDISEIPTETRKAIEEIDRKAKSSSSDSELSEDGLIRLAGNNAEIYKKIVQSRDLAPAFERDLPCDESKFESSWKSTVRKIGFGLNVATYTSLIIWSHLAPEGMGSFLFLSYLIGDISSKVIFGFWGFDKEIVKPGLKNFINQIVGAFFFLLLVFREDAFRGATERIAVSVVIVAFMSLIVMFLKVAALSISEMRKY